ncbi:serine/threonine-protein kinase [Nocardia sp. NPDC050406]|uniref:serine/threonine-protein kinase n=1 Tax=Nocardia sp. NPDC050406 TaxID=3364318 RepID=UPI0037B8170D
MKGLGSNDPRQLGRNRMVAVIGQGGMGRVLLGQSQTGRLVAVKQIHRHLAKDPEFRARFHREVLASSKVTGAYTAAVVDSDTESDNPWLATEYIPGPSLKSVIDETGPMSLGGLKLLLAGLASALIEIHRAGLVHRDLKPANVLLAADGPRVIDFGIARALEDEQLTATGSVIGSPAFMSPEQAQGQPLTPAADVFSVGAIVTLAATGESPFSGTATPQVLYNVMYSAPDTARVPAPVRAIVERCLAKDPLQRPTPQELLDAAATIEAEPAWPGAVREAVEEHRNDSNWWAATTAKHARYEAQMLALKQRRTRSLRAAAVAIGVLILLDGTAFGAREWAQQPGHATPASDLSVQLTAQQWRTLDVCALLEDSLSRQFGSRFGEISDAIAGTCGSSFTDPSGTQRTFELVIGSTDTQSEPLLRPTGSVAAWMPMYGVLKEAASCDRWVITQNHPSVSIKLRTRISGKGDACPASEQGLRAVTNRLAVNPPRMTLPEKSIRPLDPCTLLDRKLVSELAGPAVTRSDDPTSCYWSGDSNYFSLTLTEGTRPDQSSSAYKLEPVQVDGATVYVDDMFAKFQSSRCDLTYMANPTRKDMAEVVRISFGSWTNASNPCDRAKQVFSAVLPQLPK